MTKLTAKKVENTLPRKKEYKLHDGDGLFLRVRPSGAKSWLFSFSLPNDSKLIRMTLGSLKNISLKEARAKLPELRNQVSQGIDPRNTRTAKQDKHTQIIVMQKKFSKLNMTNKITLGSLEENDFDEIVSAFKILGWNKPKSIYETYFKEQSENIRSVVVAKENGKFCGYVTIKWKSDYASFTQQNIPEISDLNVLPTYRKQGVGSALIDTCETMAKDRSYTSIGLGVGMTADYGDAQRLYVHL